MRLTSSALPSSEAFRANRAAHLEALREIEEAAGRRRAAAKRRARGTRRAARCPRATGWRGCSTPAARFSRSGPRRRMGSMMARRPARG